MHANYGLQNYYKLQNYLNSKIQSNGFNKNLAISIFQSLMKGYNKF